MGVPETKEHSRIKSILTSRLKEWFGASISEYPSSGHEMDVFGTSINGISVYIEVVWSDSRVHFFKDLTMMLESDADVKIMVGSPNVLANSEYSREFSKAALAQRRQGTHFPGQMIDGARVLTDEAFVDSELKDIIVSMVGAAKQVPARLRADVVRLRKLTEERSKADQVEEQLLTNLMPVTKLPDTVFTGDTPFEIHSMSCQKYVMRRTRLRSF